MPLAPGNAPKDWETMTDLSTGDTCKHSSFQLEWLMATTRGHI